MKDPNFVRNFRSSVLFITKKSSCSSYIWVHKHTAIAVAWCDGAVHCALQSSGNELFPKYAHKHIHMHGWNWIEWWRWKICTFFSLEKYCANNLKCNEVSLSIRMSVWIQQCTSWCHEWALCMLYIYILNTIFLSLLLRSSSSSSSISMEFKLARLGKGNCLLWK